MYFTSRVKSELFIIRYFNERKQLLDDCKPFVVNILLLIVCRFLPYSGQQSRLQKSSDFGGTRGATFDGQGLKALSVLYLQALQSF
jgi:hypothetical protein